jgi:hypothetical protein
LGHTLLHLRHVRVELLLLIGREDPANLRDALLLLALHGRVGLALERIHGDRVSALPCLAHLLHRGTPSLTLGIRRLPGLAATKRLELRLLRIGERNALEQSARAEAPTTPATLTLEPAVTVRAVRPLFLRALSGRDTAKAGDRDTKAQSNKSRSHRFLQRIM